MAEELNRLAYWRALRGFTLEQLASRSGVGIATISRIEKGVIKPYVTTLAKLAVALEVDLNELAILSRRQTA